MADIITSHPTNSRVRGERNWLWGYPALYRQFEEEVLPAMRAVDELRNRTSQVQQQSQDVSHLGPSDPNHSPPSPIPQTVGAGGQDDNNGSSTNSSYPLQHEYWLPSPYLPHHVRTSFRVRNSPFISSTQWAPTLLRVSHASYNNPPVPHHPYSYTIADHPSLDEAARRQDGPLLQLPSLHIPQASSGTVVDSWPHSSVHHPNQAIHASGGYERDAYGNRTSNMEQVPEGGHNADPVYSNGFTESMGLQVPPISSGAAGADGGHDSVLQPSSPRVVDEGQGSDNEDGGSQRRRDLRVRVQERTMTQHTEGNFEPTITE